MPIELQVITGGFLTMWSVVLGTIMMIVIAIIFLNKWSDTKVIYLSVSLAIALFFFPTVLVAGLNGYVVLAISYVISCFMIPPILNYVAQASLNTIDVAQII